MYLTGKKTLEKGFLKLMYCPFDKTLLKDKVRYVSASVRAEFPVGRLGFSVRAFGTSYRREEMDSESE